MSCRFSLVSFYLTEKERETEREKGEKEKNKIPCGLKATKHVRKTLTRILIDTRQ